ncbi:HAMP domain-containing sensor histidine kinase [Nocardioides conyzicola]|uniref:sensor histidine kinase n=1 Tax=Nocardioides conyzicola TaxID=1651781 RepID=UPI0031ED7A5E
MIAPLALLSASTLALVLVRWEDWGPRQRVIIPATDVVALTLLQIGGVAVIPTIALLTILPLVWLGFELAWAGVVAAFASACLVGGYSYVSQDVWPTTRLAWVDTLLLPLVALSLIVVAQIVSTMLRHNRNHLLTNTTELRAALQSANDQVTVAQAVLDTVGAAVWFYGPDGELKLGNEHGETFARIGGFKLDQPPYAGEHVWTADRTHRIALEDQLVPTALREEEVASHLEWWGSSGRQVALVAGSRRVRRADGTALGAVVAAWDITDLVESLRVREEFLATVSHELRSPLTSIMGYLELAQDALEPGSPALAPLAVMTRNAETLRDRISTLLVANRDVHASVEPVLQEVGPAVAEVVLRHRPAASRAGVRMWADLPDGVTGRIDPPQFDQVVDNLISNAIKYTPAGGRVDVQLHDLPGGFCLTVTDTGVGMNEVERRQAFDRFYRTTSARDSAAQGIGVGLSIVRDIVRAHGGEITLDPAPNGGTIATVIIPHEPITADDLPRSPRIG